MRFSYSAVWEDTVRTVRANSSLLLPIAGVFLFLPAIVDAYLAPRPRTQTFDVLLAHIEENWLVFLVVNLIGFVGNLAFLILALDGQRPTVGTAIRTAMMLLPAYFLVSILSGFMIGIGMMLLILPGLYLIGRLSVTGAVLVAEGRRSPIDIIKRSFAITKGNGWAIIGLVLLIIIPFYVVTLAVTFIFGSLLLLLDQAAGGAGIGAFVLLIIASALSAGFNVVLMVMIASLYRRLAGAESAGRPAD